MKDWQPIATAPTDRTPFIGYCMKAGRIIVRQEYKDGTLYTETWAIDRTGQFMADPHLWLPLPARPVLR